MLLTSRSTSDCYCYFGFILWKYDINSYQYVLVASAEDGQIFILQNTMAVMGHDCPPLHFKFPFQNKSILIKLILVQSNMINSRTTNKKIICK